MNGGRPLELFHNPKDGPDSNIGVCIGSFSEANTLVAEDAALFEQPMGYTLVAGRNLIVFRYPVHSALQGWHLETQRLLRQNSLGKYRWIIERISRLEHQLCSQPANTAVIETSIKIEERTITNYPIANTKARETLKKSKRKEADYNDIKYLGTANRRDQTCKQKQLTGYVD